MGLHWFRCHECKEHNAHRTIIINFLDRQRKTSCVVNTQNQCVATHRLIEIGHFDTVSQNQMTLINWLASMSVFSSRFKCVFHDNHNWRRERKKRPIADERWPLHRFARWSIFYSSCRANFLLLPNLSSKPSDRVIFIANIKRGDWWLINFAMICMRCVCCHLQKS